MLALALPALASTDFSLTVQVAGSGTDGWECEVEEALVEPCKAEYPAGTELVVFAKADPGSAFLEFNGDCAPLVCYLTMDENHTLTAVFEDEEAEAFALNIEELGTGTGTVQYEVNGGSLEACEAAELTLDRQLDRAVAMKPLNCLGPGPGSATLLPAGSFHLEWQTSTFT